MLANLFNTICTMYSHQMPPCITRLRCHGEFLIQVIGDEFPLYGIKHQHFMLVSTDLSFLHTSPGLDRALASNVLDRASCLVATRCCKRDRPAGVLGTFADCREEMIDTLRSSKCARVCCKRISTATSEVSYSRCLPGTNLCEYESRSLLCDRQSFLQVSVTSK
jgi:hypothetical protein